MTTAVEERPVDEQTIEERPMHAAVCEDCQRTVAFRSLPSGAGFTIISHGYEDQEITFGVGSSGYPKCPLGHGEMTLADDLDERPSAAEAISQVAEQVNPPEQMTLPGTRPPFNYQGAYLQLVGLAVDADAAHKRWEQANEHAKDLKKTWERLAEKYQVYGLELERWRKEKGDAPAPAGEKCRFEQLHPGVACPLPHDGIDPDVIASESHGIEANDLLVTKECEQTIERLKSIPHVGFTVETLKALPTDQLSELQAWAGDYEDRSPEDRVALLAEPLPRAMGTPHKAGALEPVDGGEPQQLCRECGQLLFTQEAGEPALFEGTLVGTDCQGAAKVKGHRYPKAKRSKQTRRQRAEASGE